MSTISYLTHNGQDATAASLELLTQAYEVARENISTYRSKFSKRTFTQPQLLAGLIFKFALGLSFDDLIHLQKMDEAFLSPLGLKSPPAAPCYVRLSQRVGNGKIEALFNKALSRIDARSRQILFEFRKFKEQDPIYYVTGSGDARLGVIRGNNGRLPPNPWVCTLPFVRLSKNFANTHG